MARSVASIQGQIFIFGRPLPAKIPTAWKAMLGDLDGTIEHITTFSRGGLQVMTDEPVGISRALNPSV